MFISPAYAQATAPSGFDFNLIFLPLMFAALYFLMIRPQMKRSKEHRAMTEGLQKGDEVVAGGGILGRITKLSDAYVTLEVAQGTEIVVQRGAVIQLLPKGTLKSI